MAKKKRQVSYLVAPTHWRSLLFNGDASGMENEDYQSALEWIENTVSTIGNCLPVDEYDLGFCRPNGWKLAGNYTEYTFYH